MFKRKIVTGVVTDVETTESASIYGYATKINTYKFSRDVFRQALFELLKECNVDVELDDDDSIIWICGIPISVVSGSSLNYFGAVALHAPFNTSFLSLSPTRSSALKIMPNSINEPYNFSITFVGEPKGMFSIYWTANNDDYNSQNTYATVTFFHLTSLLGNEKCIEIYAQNNTSSGCFMYQLGQTKEDIKYIDLALQAHAVSPRNTSGKVKEYMGSKILLSPQYSQHNLFRVDNCYEYDNTNNSIPVSGFSMTTPLILTINDEDYMLYNTAATCLVKLIT